MKLECLDCIGITQGDDDGTWDIEFHSPALENEFKVPVAGDEEANKFKLGTSYNLLLVECPDGECDDKATGKNSI
jgi:hypothetical protein